MTFREGGREARQGRQTDREQGGEEIWDDTIQYTKLSRCGVRERLGIGWFLCVCNSVYLKERRILYILQ